VGKTKFIITGSILGIGAVLLSYFGNPRIQAYAFHVSLEILPGD
jgi:hypothetical protein